MQIILRHVSPRLVLRRGSHFTVAEGQRTVIDELIVNGNCRNGHSKDSSLLRPSYLFIFKSDY